MHWKSAFRAAALASSAFFITTTSAVAAVATQNEVAIDYDLPSQDLGDTLRAIARASHREILFESDTVHGLKAPVIKGRYLLDEALRKALSETTLTIEYRAGAALIRAQNPLRSDETASPGSAVAITVTGTRIRGVGSASPVTVLTRRSLEQSGVSSLADFTRVLPQNYTGGQNPGIAGDGEQGGQSNLNNSAALNLRGLGPDATLTLLNGHRLAYDSINQGIDISAIPLSAIERIEVVADGASALYGSDAVAGVANIILRHDYEGVETTARVGGATDGGDFQHEYGLVGGHRWTTGGFMIALDGSSATPITARQRSYTRGLDPSLFLTDRDRQYSGILSIHQQIAPGLIFEMDGNAMDRSSLVQAPFSPTADVHISGLVDHSRVTSWGLTPTLQAELGRWQASVSATGSDSRTFLAADNYYGGTPVRSRILYEDNLKGVEGTGEGPLFPLPGGDARLALGGGFRTIWFHDRQLDASSGQNVVVKNFTETRNVRFAYGELSLPLVSPDLGVPLIQRLTFSAAVRYEHWNQIASVSTPKLGVIYQPARDVTVRATWGKSFKIPTLYQINRPETGGLYGGSLFSPPPLPAGSTVLIVSGSAPNLKPERATSWSATVELKPRFVRDLNIQATYFHVDYRDRIAKPITSALTALYNPLYNSLITYDPSAAQVNALVASLPGGLFNLTGAPVNPANVGAIINGSARNTERQRIRGADLNADYRIGLGDASQLLVTGAASYLQSKQQLVAGQPLLPLAGTIFNPPHWRGRAGVTWDSRHASVSAFVNYLGATIDNTTTTLERVSPFVTLDLNATMRTAAAAGLLRNIELRLSVLNILNQKPHPIRNQYPEAAPYDSTNESPVGRFIGASLRKHW
jgi:iron complex outermembrane recepter protein